jgi:hypothetical protein
VNRNPQVIKERMARRVSMAVCLVVSDAVACRTGEAPGAGGLCW